METNQHNYGLITIKLLILLLVSLNFILLSCKAQRSQEVSLNEVAAKELGNEYSVTFNEDETYALYQQKRVNDHPNRIIKYIVIKVSSKEIVKSGNFQSGYVKWLSNESIEVATSDKVSANLTKTTIHIKSNEQ